MKIVLQSNITKVSARYRDMARNLPGVVNAALQSLAREEGIPLFQNTVKTWQSQPTFLTVKQPRGWAIAAEPLYPYAWIDRGTPRHPIAARNKPFLVWGYPFVSKSKPGIISSYAGSVGGKIASKRQVYNSVKARRWTDIIMRRLQARAANRVRAALDRESWGMGAGL